MAIKKGSTAARDRAALPPAAGCDYYEQSFVDGNNLQQPEENPKKTNASSTGKKSATTTGEKDATTTGEKNSTTTDEKNAKTTDEKNAKTTVRKRTAAIAGVKRARSNDLLNTTIKLPKVFKGGPDFLEFRMWCAHMDAYFDVMETPEPQRIAIAATRMRDSAMVWYLTELEKCKSSRAGANCTPGKPPQQQQQLPQQGLGSWDEFKEKLEMWAIPDRATLSDQILGQLSRIKQTTLSVRPYVDEFRALAWHALALEPKITDGDLMKYFADGLRTAFRHYLAPLTLYENLERMIAKCYIYDYVRLEKLREDGEKKTAAATPSPNSKKSPKSKT